VGSFQAGLVVCNGLLYVTTAYGTYAIDAKTCERRWAHHYPEDKLAPLLVNRGVAIYRGEILRVTPNGHLLALDALTGKQLWDVWVTDERRGYQLTSAPLAYDGYVFIGEAGADWGAVGHVFAFDAKTGAHVWTFDMIPSGKQPGANSWKEGAEHGGGSTWTTFTLDPIRHELLVPIGNPAPDFDGAMRPGDNLFTDSVVAMDYRTGKLAWHVQQVPHDVHDWDTAAAPVLLPTDSGTGARAAGV
jgi:alcohol dehydrogenase (cytochrome c)